MGESILDITLRKDNLNENKTEIQKQVQQEYKLLGTTNKNAKQKGYFEFGRFKISYEEENIEKELIEEEISQDRYVRTRFNEQFYIDKEGKTWKYKIQNIEEIIYICSVHENLAQQILEQKYSTKYYELNFLRSSSVY